MNSLKPLTVNRRSPPMQSLTPTEHQPRKGCLLSLYPMRWRFATFFRKPLNCLSAEHVQNPVQNRVQNRFLHFAKCLIFFETCQRNHQVNHQHEDHAQEHNSSILEECDVEAHKLQGTGAEIRALKSCTPFLRTASRFPSFLWIWCHQLWSFLSSIMAALEALSCLSCKIWPNISAERLGQEPLSSWHNGKMFDHFGTNMFIQSIILKEQQLFAKSETGLRSWTEPYSEAKEERWPKPSLCWQFAGILSFEGLKLKQSTKAAEHPQQMLSCLPVNPLAPDLCSHLTHINAETTLYHLFLGTSFVMKTVAMPPQKNLLWPPLSTVKVSSSCLWKCLQHQKVTFYGWRMNDLNPPLAMASFKCAKT